MEIIFCRAQAQDSIAIQNLYQQLVIDSNIKVNSEQVLLLENDEYSSAPAQTPNV